MKTSIKYSDIFNSKMILYYQDHIVDFVYDIIFQNKEEYALSDQQIQFLEGVQKYKRVSAKSGKGIGKTAGISFAIHWFLTCFENPRVVCTAPTYPNLMSALWPEVAIWLDRSLIKHIFTHTSTRLYLNSNPKYWWAEPRTSREKENMSGLHADNMLIIIDEASGIKDDIFEALDTTLTGANNKFVMIGNPTQTSGPFFDSFHKHSARWKNYTFNSELSPFVKKEQIEYYEEKYGKHHDLYLVNILGEFPSGNPDAFISLSDAHSAVQRWDSIEERGEIEVGIDVARYGDDNTILYWRWGFKVFPAKTLAKSSIVDCTNLVYETVEEIRAKYKYDKRIRVKVDDTGVGGGVTDLLREDRSHNIDVIPINFGGKGDEKYSNEVSKMWGRLKDVIKYIGLPDDQHLIEEVSTRRWKILSNGKIAIESKADYKRQFKSSPDRADALILCFAEKESERVVLKDFDPLDSLTIKENVGYAGEEKYCSLYVTKDLYYFMSFLAWDGNRLYVYDEYTGNDSMIYIATNILSHQPLNKIIGSQNLFSDNGQDLASKFRKYKINIFDNYNFNEIAAIEVLSNMVTQKKLVVNKQCIKTINQLSRWKMGMSRGETELEFGLCYAICNLISQLKNKIKMDKKDEKLIEIEPKNYNSEIILPNKEIEKKYAWMLI